MCEWIITHRFQLTAFMIGKAHLGVVLGYLIAYGIPGNLMVTSELFAYEAFRELMVCFVTLECLVTLCYASRFRRAEPMGAWLIATFVDISWIGFVFLAYNQDTAKHFTGVGLFIAGNSIGYIFILCLTKPQHGNKRWYDYAVYASVLAGFGLTAAFVSMYMDNSQPSTWLVEQLSLCFYVATFTLFFAYHSFDPLDPFPKDYSRIRPAPQYELIQPVSSGRI